MLADDHFVTREGTRRVLDSQPDMDVVAEAADGVETIRLAQALQPDLLVLDISMPRINGIEVAREIRQRLPATRIVILIYHGGTVQTVPAVFIVYWGTEWSDGFTATHGGFTYTSATIQNYVNSFFANLGGSAWAGIQTQYCQGIMAPAFSCTGQPAAQMITNPTGQLKGTWTDPTPVPADIVPTALASNFTTDPIEAEAIKAAAHFGYEANATYMIFIPPNHGATGYARSTAPTTLKPATPRVLACATPSCRMSPSRALPVERTV